IAAPRPSGTARSSASSDDTSVPKMNGRAPNCSATGSQFDVVMNAQPNRRSEGQAACAITAAMPATSTSGARPAALVISRNPRSPKRRRARRAPASGGTVGVPAPAPADRPKTTAISSLRGQQRPALVYDLAKLGFDLLDDWRRQWRIEQVGGVLLAVVRRPPEEAHDGLTLHLVRLLAVDEQPREAGDGVHIGPGSVRQRDAEVGRHLGCRTCGGRRRGPDRP